MFTQISKCVLILSQSYRHTRARTDGESRVKRDKDNPTINKTWAGVKEDRNWNLVKILHVDLNFKWMIFLRLGHSPSDKLVNRCTNLALEGRRKNGNKKIAN